MTKRATAPGRVMQITWQRSQQLVEFGLLLGQKRERLGLSQTEMARHIGVDQSRISRIEMGFGTPKDFPTAQAYAESYLLDDRETNAWYQLLFGTSRVQAESRSHAPLGTAEPTPQPIPGSAGLWKDSAAAHLVSAATNLQEHFLWGDAISLFRMAEGLLGVTPRAAKAACEIASTYVELSDYESALHELLRIETVYVPVMSLDIEREIAFVRGWIAYDHGQFAQAAMAFEACLRLIAQLGREQVSTDAHHFLGRVYSDWGQAARGMPEAVRFFHQAVAHYDQAYALHHSQGKHSGLAYDAFRKAQLVLAQGKWREARRLRDSARLMFGNEIELFTLHIDIEEAVLMLKNGDDLDTPQRVAEQALHGWSQVKRAMGMAESLDLLGEVQVQRARIDHALELFVCALCIYPFEQHLRNRQLWHKICLLIQEVISEHSGAYSSRLVDELQERAISRQGYFVYLDHVAADRSSDIARIFQSLRSI